MEQFKSCLTCAYRALNPQQCPLIGYSYSGDGNQACPYWTAELPKCDYCGRIDPNYVLTEAADESWKRLCKNCKSNLGTCAMCSKSSTCDFETNPSPIPKAVTKSFQQGPMTQVVSVKSDERIAETCAKNCECFDHENYICLREYGCCEKYFCVFDMK